MRPADGNLDLIIQLGAFGSDGSRFNLPANSVVDACKNSGYDEIRVGVGPGDAMFEALIAGSGQGDSKGYATVVLSPGRGGSYKIAG